MASWFLNLGPARNAPMNISHASLKKVIPNIRVTQRDIDNMLIRLKKTETRPTQTNFPTSNVLIQEYLDRFNTIKGNWKYNVKPEVPVLPQSIIQSIQTHKKLKVLEDNPIAWLTTIKSHAVTGQYYSTSDMDDDSSWSSDTVTDNRDTYSDSDDSYYWDSNNESDTDTSDNSEISDTLGAAHDADNTGTSDTAHTTSPVGNSIQFINGKFQ